MLCYQQEGISRAAQVYSKTFGNSPQNVSLTGYHQCVLQTPPTNAANLKLYMVETEGRLLFQCQVLISSYNSPNLQQRVFRPAKSKQFYLSRTLQTGANLLPEMPSTICSCFRAKARLNCFSLSYTATGLIVAHLLLSVRGDRQLISLILLEKSRKEKNCYPGHHLSSISFCCT